MAVIVIAILIARSRWYPGGQIFSSSPRNVPFHVVVVQRQLIRHFRDNTHTTFLPFANPPVNQRYSAHTKIIRMGTILCPLTTDINDDAITCICRFTFFELIAEGLIECKLRFSLLRPLQDDIDHTAHRFRTVKCRCRPLDNLDPLDHRRRYPLRTRIVFEIHWYTVHHDKRTAVIATQAEPAGREAEILPCLTVRGTRRADLLINRLEYVAIACLFNILCRNDRCRRRGINITLHTSLCRHHRLAEAMCICFNGGIGSRLLFCMPCSGKAHFSQCHACSCCQLLPVFHCSLSPFSILRR